MGLARTHFGHALAVTALDYLRMADWRAEVLRAKTRRSSFIRLMARS